DATDVDAVLAHVYEARSERPQPERDEKVVVSWNAMAARGSLRAGAALHDGEIRARGLGLVRMLLERADVTEGRRGGAPELVHVLDDPAVGHVRLAEDYAHLAAACLAAHAAEPGGGYLEEAERLQAAADERFREDGAVYATPDDTELPARPLDDRDSPSPSAASVLARNALELAAATGRPEYRAFAEEVLSGFRLLASEAPPFAAAALSAMVDLLSEE
ncbi:MAG: hypothetical protein IBX62_09690, partial [Coriobacteriia bacterium]|nr:hypothetical protein [Coriobacteriia bacterium]